MKPKFYGLWTHPTDWPALGHNEPKSNLAEESLIFLIIFFFFFSKILNPISKVKFVPIAIWFLVLLLVFAAMEENESCGSRAADSSSPTKRSRQNRERLEVFNEVLSRLQHLNHEDAKLPGFEDQLWLHFNRLPPRYGSPIFSICFSQFALFGCRERVGKQKKLQNRPWFQFLSSYSLK